MLASTATDLGIYGRDEKYGYGLKDQAMPWEYVIEWSVVTSTFTICGVVVWTLMVRRRLYRESGSTRFVG